MTRSGVVCIKFRCVKDHKCSEVGHAKYLYEGKAHLYNVETLHIAERLVAITEGEVDTLSLQQAGIPSVACPGVSAWKPHYPRLFVGYPEVLIFPDNDVPKLDGSNPGLEFAQRVKQDVPQARIVQMPVGVDVNDVFVRDGAGGLLERAGLLEEDE